MLVMKKIKSNLIEKQAKAEKAKQRYMELVFSHN